MANTLTRASAIAIAVVAAGCFSGPEPLPPDQALAKAAARVDTILRDANSTPDTPAPPAVQETPRNPNEVSFWFFQHALYANLLSHPELLASFRERHPNIKLDQQYIGDWNVAVQKLTVTVAAGDVPDIAIVKRPWLERLVRSGRIAALDSLLPTALLSDLRQPARDAFTVDGHLYALPADGYSSVLYFNRDLVGDIAPQTWDELKKTAEAIVKKVTAPNADKIIPIGDIPFLETLWSCGGDIVRGAHSGMGDPEARETLDFLFGLRTAQLADPAVLGSPDRAFNLFLAGRAAMTVASSEYLPRTKDCPFKVGLAPVPGKTVPLSLASDNAIVVFNRYAESKRSALTEVLDFLTGPSMQGQNAAKQGSAPVRSSGLTAAADAIPAGLDKAYQLSRSTPLTPRWNEIEFETMRYIQLAYMWEDKKP